MESFKEYMLNEEELKEALITFSKQAYPKFNTVVIMAGGAGSGKGFVLSNLVGVEGYTFDVDAVKTLSMAAKGITHKIKQKFGKDISKFDLKNPSNVADLHAFVSGFFGEYGIDDARKKAMFKGVMLADPSRKPNIIFDVTLKDMQKLANLTRSLEELGYSKKNIHIVWVVNDIEVAKKQNQARSRTVPVDILVNTHRGVSQTMNDIISMGSRVKKYMDGDIVFAFNKFKVDAELEKSGSGGQYIKKANYIYVKRAGGKTMSLDDVKKEIGNKIASYVPKNVSWS